MPLQDSLAAAKFPKTKTFKLDGRAWMTDESTFRILEQHTSVGTEKTSSWYFG